MYALLLKLQMHSISEYNFSDEWGLDAPEMAFVFD